MTGWKPCLIALALWAWFGTTAAEAQGVVPGGWAPQFGSQTFVAPGAVGGGGYFNYGYGVPPAGFSPSGVSGFAPYGPTSRPVNPSFAPSTQTVNAIDPLVGAIRRSSGRKRTR